MKLFKTNNINLFWFTIVNYELKIFAQKNLKKKISLHLKNKNPFLGVNKIIVIVIKKLIINHKVLLLFCNLIKISKFSITIKFYQNSFWTHLSIMYVLTFILRSLACPATSLIVLFNKIRNRMIFRQRKLYGMSQPGCCCRRSHTCCCNQRY